MKELKNRLQRALESWRGPGHVLFLRVFLPTYLALILFGMVYVYPDLLRFSPTASEGARPMDTIGLAVPKIASGPRVDSTFIYRQDERRSGWFEVTTNSSDWIEKWNFGYLNVSIHGASKATPAIDSTGVYVGGDSGWFYAFDFSGNIRWRFNVGGALRGIHSTAVLTQDHVIFGAYNGVLYSLKKSDGSLHWLKHVGSAIGSSPLLYNGKIYVAVETTRPPNGYLISVDASNGALQWVTDWLGEQAHSSPTLAKDLGLLFVGANDAKVHAFVLETGQAAWSQGLDGPVKSTGTYDGARLYYSSWGGALFALNPRNGEILWRAGERQKSQSSPTLIPGADLITVASEEEGLSAYRTSDGKRAWNLKIPSGVPVLASPVITHQRSDSQTSLLWFPCKPKTLCALDPRRGDLRSEIALRGALTSVPSFFNEMLVVAMNDPGGLSLFLPSRSPASGPRGRK